MTREYIYEILKITTGILVLLTLAANFLFNRNGLVTRKTLKVTYVGGLLSWISLLLTVWLSPSELPILTFILCGGTVFVLFSIMWAWYYFTLPYFEKMVEKNEKKD
jgi:hypothetical protein